MQLRSLRGRPGFYSRYQSELVLYTTFSPRPRPACGQLRGEPVIPGLDLAFPPRPKSTLRIARQKVVEPPREFPRASPCSGLDRPASGLVALIVGVISTAVLAICLDLRVYRNGLRHRDK